jgi:hypothetical protein
MGGRIGVRVRPGRSPLELDFDAGAVSGSNTDRLGVVSALSATAGAGVAYVSTAGSTQIAEGAVFEAGYGRVHGDAGATARGGSQSTFVASVALDVGVRFPSVAGTWITVDALGGWCASGLRGFADDRAVAGMSGALGAVRLGLAR